MSAATNIEWTRGPNGEKGSTWNPIRGCKEVSLGCARCYARRFAERWRGVKDHPFEQGFDLRLVPEALDLPLRWKKPRRIFVNSMSDLFHEDVPDEYIAAVFGVMAECPQHTFQVLTKRPERLRRWFDWLDGTIDPIVAQYNKDGLRQHPRGEWYATQTMGWADHYLEREVSERDEECPPVITWPLPNVWLGVSVENQATADERIPHLLATPAALRFLSCEPLLGPIDLARIRIPDAPSSPFAGHALHECRGFAHCVDWVIVGGESGPDARPCRVEWIRDILRQCRDAGVPAFVKQLGACYSDPVDGIAGRALRVPDEAAALVSRRLRSRKGADPAEWPPDLRVREMPEIGR